MTALSVPALLALNRVDLDHGHSHVEVDDAICSSRCVRRVCVTVCPADVYSEHEGRVIADCAACLECGTCLVACEPGAIIWHYPADGHGIQYRYG